MKISLNLTAESLINALRWRRQDLLEMKRPDLGARPKKLPVRRSAELSVNTIWVQLEPSRRPLTKAQRLAAERKAARFSSATT